MDAPERASLTVTWRHRELWLETSSGTHETVSVNGVALEESVPLHNADVIGVGAQRFVVDAWALTPDADTAERPQDLDIAVEPAEDSAGPRGDVWWLILTAAALGLLIALFLLFRL